MWCCQSSCPCPCAPPEQSVHCMSNKKCLFSVFFMWTTKNTKIWKMLGLTPTSQNNRCHLCMVHNACWWCTMHVGGAQCMSVMHNACRWCTMHVSGAQCMSVVHNVVLYHWGGAQRISHKARHRDTCIHEINWFLLCFYLNCWCMNINFTFSC